MDRLLQVLIFGGALIAVPTYFIGFLPTLIGWAVVLFYRADFRPYWGE